MQRLLAVGLLCPILGWAAPLTYHKCTDADDNIAYSIDPCPRGSRQQRLQDDWSRSESPVPTGRYRPIQLHRQHDGHYYATLNINGVAVRGLIDTGASMLALSPSVIQKTGINTSKAMAGRAETANGTTDTKIFTIPRLDLYDGSYYDIVAGTVNSELGKGHDALIGMSFLNRFNVSIQGAIMTLDPK